MNTKFDKLSPRIETIDRKAEAAGTLVKQNQNNISNHTSESTALQEKLADQVKKIHELEENIKDQINRNSGDTLIKRKHGITFHMCSSFLCGLFGWNIQISSLVTLKEHTEVITETLIHLSM